MGVYIPNMKKPIACVKCRFCTAFNCLASGKYIKDHYKRNDNCPLVEVKAPHGRLKDADALFEEGADVCVGTYNALEEQGFSYAKIASMPTIIEAEGENNG